MSKSAPGQVALRIQGIPQQNDPMWLAIQAGTGSRSSGIRPYPAPGTRRWRVRQGARSISKGPRRSRQDRRQRLLGDGGKEVSFAFTKALVQMTRNFRIGSNNWPERVMRYWSPMTE